MLQPRLLLLRCPHVLGLLQRLRTTRIPVQQLRPHPHPGRRCLAFMMPRPSKSKSKMATAIRSAMLRVLARVLPSPWAIMLAFLHWCCQLSAVSFRIDRTGVDEGLVGAHMKHRVDHGPWLWTLVPQAPSLALVPQPAAAI